MMNTTRKVMSVSMILLLAIAAVFLVSLNMGTMKIPLAVFVDDSIIQHHRGLHFGKLLESNFVVGVSRQSPLAM